MFTIKRTRIRKRQLRRAVWIVISAFAAIAMVAGSFFPYGF
jgi:hypothetical protein